MKAIKTCIKLVLITAVLTGCTAMVGSKNVDFISGQSQAPSEKTTILICRPSSLFQVFNSAGLTINSSPVTEIGSGEIYSIDVPKSNKLDLVFTLPVTDVIKNLWEKPKTFSLRLNPDTQTYFIFLSVESGDIDASPNMAGNPAKEIV